MQTTLSPEFKDTPRGDAAEAILRTCVHCGFCNATCPTYQVLGDELDGPRGRIYLIKQLLEGAPAGRSTQQHLDRCLTCLNCETTCPSGVEYGKLVAIGRELVEERVPRPLTEKTQRWLLKEGLTSVLFAPALKVAQVVRALLPAGLRHHVPPRSTETGRPVATARATATAPASATGGLPEGKHARKVLLLAGCVQPSLRPNINRATVRVLDACGIETIIAADAGCCGALREHLADAAGHLANARRNIDAWWPLIEAGAVEAIVANASACGLAIKHYGEALGGDGAYRQKAARISALARDLSELLPGLGQALQGKIQIPLAGRVVLHPPCTLQHGQRLRGGIEAGLRALGFDVRLALHESHLCCGSAGTYSVLQPQLATELRDRKLRELLAAEPDCIVSANIGCIQHLQSGTTLAVRHWIELLDDALAEAASAKDLGA
jgi:glycolate oxidase iron-sulfur subunit